MLVAVRRRFRTLGLEQESLCPQRACRHRRDDKKQNNFCEVTHHSVIGCRKQTQETPFPDVSCESSGG